MNRRETIIASSVACTLLREQEWNKQPSIWEKISAFFNIYWLTFDCIRGDLFTDLRTAWEINNDDYRANFNPNDASETALVSIGDMGYSGSTFFVTLNSKFLVKSIPRHFEHSFFRDDLLWPYTEYMLENPDSLLVRITDFLEHKHYSIGSLLGLAPSHHIIMENILNGQDQESSEWETYDLKPMSYFYPERDVASGVLTSEATKSKLADHFNEELVLTLDQAEALKAQLNKDTDLLSQCNAVDYSLFLVCIPVSAAPESTLQPEEAASHGSEPLSWKTGIKSADGKYVYRASILDFFWAKHKIHAKAMTGLINTYNKVDNKGPMSVTTTSPEYRERFLKMCHEMIKVQPTEIL